jgi:hypothetical protein
VPEPVTLPGAIEPQVKPEGTVAVRVTTPVKPFAEVIVIVEVADCPALAGAGEVADMVKFWNLNIAIAV